MVNLPKKLVSTLLIMVGLVFSSQAHAVALGCQHLNLIANGYLNQHVNYKKMSKSLETRTIDQMIEKLDPTKVYFLKSDVDKIKKDLSGIFELVAKRDCSKIKSVNQLYLTRVSA
jgi:carboxyl-terminal processing protease